MATSEPAPDFDGVAHIHGLQAGAAAARGVGQAAGGFVARPLSSCTYTPGPSLAVYRKGAAGEPTRSRITRS
jgi:hypothetical protein